MSKDRQYLDTLRDYYAANKVIPSFAVLAKLLGFASTGAISALVGRLKAAGYLESGDGKRLRPGPRFFEREMVGAVRAGGPDLPGDLPAEPVNIERELVRVPSRTVLLKVKGDSMTDAGLLPGDTVVVQKGAPARPGDVVVAIVDNEFTLKTLAYDGKAREFYLQPANKGYPTIRPRENLELFGVVVGSYRTYGR